MDTNKKRKNLSRLLLDWYYAERRILPWREDPTPYHVWVSEIMLQQTRVEAVKEYYRRFLEALPDVRALAEAYGLEVGYDAATNTATVNSPGQNAVPAVPAVISFVGA